MRKMLLVGEDEAIYFILSESGFAEDLEAIAKNRDDIHLITGENLFGIVRKNIYFSQGSMLYWEKRSEGAGQ